MQSHTETRDVSVTSVCSPFPLLIGLGNVQQLYKLTFVLLLNLFLPFVYIYSDVQFSYTDRNSSHVRRSTFVCESFTRSWYFATNWRKTSLMRSGRYMAPWVQSHQLHENRKLSLVLPILRSAIYHTTNILQRTITKS